MKGAVTSTPLVTWSGGRIATFHPEIHLPVNVVFSTAKAGNTSPKYGNGAVENRHAVLEEVGLLDKEIVTMVPQHGTRIVLVPSGQDKVECDGLITCKPGVVLEVRAADCFPVILMGKSESGKPCVALLYAGKKGLEGGIVRWGIEAFSKEFYIPLQQMSMAVGPGICRICYEGTNLFGQIRDQAQEAGLEGDIWRANRCTRHSEDLRFPSRSRNLKEGKPDNERFETLVWLPD